jgi:phosphatidylglycerophosphate synthase
VNRRLGRYLAAWAYRRGLTPNQVTAISAAFTFTAIAVLASVRPAGWVGPVVAAGLLLGYAFDSADGQLARFTHTGSSSGEFLDHGLDCVKIVALHLAVAICWYRFFDLRDVAYVLIPFGYCVVAATFFFATILSEQLRGNGAGARPKSASYLRSYLVLAWDFGLLSLIFLLLAAPALFGALYTAMALANLGLLIVASRRWYTELRQG